MNFCSSPFWSSSPSWPTTMAQWPYYGGYYNTHAAVYPYAYNYGVAPLLRLEMSTLLRSKDRSIIFS
ncbi:hypothetical protein CDAR_603201 [Caerostris darwini]|uniref:Uncharacterized protein n=1 Tax=Caerostris darwini TaxID=1538125 RepID=A0AAV4UJ02_9ARAC|nr:hypothetical protein CDAR_603201 [Caerostris darwini]